MPAKPPRIDLAASVLAARTSWPEVPVENPRPRSAEPFESDLASVQVRGGETEYLILPASKSTNLLVEDCTIADLDSAAGARVQ